MTRRAAPPDSSDPPDLSDTSDLTTGRLRVLGIDPGLADVGWGLIAWSAASGTARLVDYGVVRTTQATPFAERLDHIYRELAALIERHRPQVVAIEELFFARNIKTAMVVAHGRAACVLATARPGVTLVEYTPLQIKQALTGHGRADKRQVQQMVRVLLALREIPRPDHAADALAAALCHVHGEALREKVERARAALGLRAPSDLSDPSDGSDPSDSPDPRKLLLAQRRGRRRRRRV